ncbi:hypothetical protein BG258_01700 [Lysinibacillus fusiformis]|uniref:Uncharacterized protein n=1 Tax=Lysinibacillus fusiformis TaxID=28031 RepID=A0A1E4R2J8_9BACI|nr:hypothetical protein BG258_01700 [Lysinibacillus fusiformis]
MIEVITKLTFAALNENKKPPLVPLVRNREVVLGKLISMYDQKRDVSIIFETSLFCVKFL